MMDLLDAILLLRNALPFHKNTKRYHYVTLGLVKPKTNIPYDMYARQNKRLAHFLNVKKYI